MNRSYDKWRARRQEQREECAEGSVRDNATLATSNDIVTGGIITAAILLFIGTGGTALHDSIRWLTGASQTMNNAMVSAVLLNIAIILFGWRRYRDLQAEIVKRINAEQRAHELARTDPLTSLPNRRAIKDHARILLGPDRDPARNVAYLLIDLDNFKQINDLYGHDAGDAVLTGFARRLEMIAPAHSYIARLGGDEFACIYLFEAGQEKSVEALARSIIEQTATPIVHEGELLEVTASLGISLMDGDCAGIADLMRRADIAMYAAKHEGKNGFCWFDQNMEKTLRDRNALEIDIRRGIAAREFVPFYQPQVDLATGALNGFEMLARWVSPKRGMISPDVFIPVAEEMGVIGDLSLLVIRQAMVDAREWTGQLTLSINISPLQLLDPWLAQKLVKMLVETGFPANRLEIEITETSLFENLPLAQSTIISLKNQGVRIALDDFGTGYSSLAHLRSLPFDSIKIDRSFIASLIDNDDSQAIVSLIANLGQSLSIPITAEGIENDQVVRRLNEIGHFKGQGHLFGQPVPAEQIRCRLAEEGLLRAMAGMNEAGEADVVPATGEAMMEAQRLSA